MQFKQIGIIIAGGGLLMFAASQDGSDVDIGPASGTQSEIASAGDQPFTVPTPAGFTAVAKPDGVELMETGSLRTPLSVQIGLRQDGAVPDATQEREVAGVQARYRVRVLEGGSAGPLWQLEAARDTPKGALMMTASQQSELGAPDFDRAWQIFETVEVRP